MIRIERNDPTYILGLIGQVVSVSLETVKIGRSLPPLGLPADEERSATTAEWRPKAKSWALLDP
jgi:hypothetical protein